MQKAHTKERYFVAIRRWVLFLWKEPNGLIAGSCWFVLTCLPLVTIGPATLALTRYMRDRSRGVKTSWRMACKYAFVEQGARGWLMGLSDALAVIMSGGCVIAVFDGEIALAARSIYALLLIIDVLYMLSSIYRYPALNREEDTQLTMLIARGFLMALGNPGWTFMFFSAQLLALLVCGFTGIGLVLLYPAAASLLAVNAYDQMNQEYFGEDEDNEHD